jgi:hypothetical protein
MKWNKEKKELVYKLLSEKAQPFHFDLTRGLYDPPNRINLPGLIAWSQFLDSFGINRVQRGFEPFVDNHGRPCLIANAINDRIGVWRLAPPYCNNLKIMSSVKRTMGGRVAVDVSEIIWSRGIIYPEKGYGEPAQSNKHIMIEDPFLAKSPFETGLRIPKEVAEKFLVLGVP